MLGISFDTATLAVVLLGALVAGFTTGLAGFGTALVASGFWLHALPAAVVPPQALLLDRTTFLDCYVYNISPLRAKIQ
jgi:hypothetical protein